MKNKAFCLFIAAMLLSIFCITGCSDEKDQRLLSNGNIPSTGESMVNEPGDTLIIKPVRVIEADTEFEERITGERETYKKLITDLFETILDITQGNDCIKLDLSLKNISGEDLKFYFSSGQRFDIFVKDHKGEEVYRWSHDKGFTCAIIDIHLKKGEKLSFSEVWDYTDNDGNRVPPGKYSVTVMFPAKLKHGRTVNPKELTAVKDIEVR